MKESMFQKCAKRFILKILSWVYRVEVRGEEFFPTEGQGVLLVCNHVSYVDAIILQMASPRAIRFLSFAEFFKQPVLGSLLRVFRAIPISSTHAKDAVVKAAEALQEGEMVCIFPEGKLTLTGELQEFQKGFELIARRAHVPVMPVHLGSLWDSIFSHQGGRVFLKWPKRLPFPVQVRFGKCLKTEEATAKHVRQIMLELAQ